MYLEEFNHIKNAISIFPSLTDNTFRKGDYGRVVVIGGSVEYTGAPFFTSYTPLQIVCYVYICNKTINIFFIGR